MLASPKTSGYPDLKPTFASKALLRSLTHKLKLIRSICVSWVLALRLSIPSDWTMGCKFWERMGVAKFCGTSALLNLFWDKMFDARSNVPVSMRVRHMRPRIDMPRHLSTRLCYLQDYNPTRCVWILLFCCNVGWARACANWFLWLGVQSAQKQANQTSDKSRCEVKWWKSKSWG